MIYSGTGVKNGRIVAQFTRFCALGRQKIKELA